MYTKVNQMKNALLLPVLFLLTTYSSLGQQKWQTYTSAVGKYTIQMPANADVKHSASDAELTTEKLEIKDGDILYVASVTIQETELTESDELEKISLEIFTETVGGTLLSQTAWKVKKREGIMATIELKEGIIIYYRVLIDGNRQFQVVAVTEVTSKANSKFINKYFKSFKPE